jgi:hypothetical protein
MTIRMAVVAIAGGSLARDHNADKFLIAEASLPHYLLPRQATITLSDNRIWRGLCC